MKLLATKKIKMTPVEIIERMLGEDAEEYREVLDEYKTKCDREVELTLVLGEDEFSLRTDV